MPIDYTRIHHQIEKMGRMIAHKMQDQSERVQAAFEQFEFLPDNAILQAKVQVARDNDAGYRGAAPMSVDGERLNGKYAVPDTPELATILAADGSQVYPDIHSSPLYYLTNVAVYTFYHGGNQLPEEYAEPELFYADSFLRDDFDQLITTSTVNARRTVKEINLLARMCWEKRELPHPMIALFDGRLLFWLGKDVPDFLDLQDDYHAGLVQMRDTHEWTMNHHGYPVSVAGYVDRPTSRFVIALLQLLLLDDARVTRQELLRASEYEGLDDRWLFQRWLRPGERSALMIQQSPQNKNYRQRGESYEIVFFYLNVGRVGSPHLARVEIPMWVAQLPEAVNILHALLVRQGEIAGFYPYALTRADELAVVQNPDRRTLRELIQTELLRHQQTSEDSGKLIGKYQTRSGRQGFGLGQPKSVRKNPF